MYLDIFILLVLLIGAVRGYFTGFVLQSFTLIALFGGIWAGIKFNHFASQFLKNFLDIKDTFLPYISFVVLFIVIIVLVHLLGMLITKIIDKSALGALNRTGGILFGLLKFVIILSVCMFLIGKFDRKEKLIAKKYKDESFLYKPLEKIAPSIFPFMDFEKIKKGFIERST